MNDDSKKADQKSQIVLGRVFDPSGGSPGSLFLIDSAHDDRRIACDAFGRFKIPLIGGRKANLAIERDGMVVSQIELDPTSLTGELLVEIPPRPALQEDAVSIAIGASRPKLLKEGVIDRLRALPTHLAIEEQTVGNVERILDELQELSDLALPALAGDPTALRQLRADFEFEIPFDFELDLMRFKPGPGDFGIDPCGVVPRSPWSIVMAGMMMDAGEGTVWAGKAVSAILRRSEPAVRVARALSGFDAGQVGEDLLHEALSFAVDVSTRGLSQAPVWGLFQERSDGPGFQPPARSFDLGGIRDGFGGRPTGSQFGTLLDPCNLEWLECAHTFVTAPPPATPKPPAVGRVEPTDIQAETATQIRLFPPAGGSFGNSQNPGWVIVLGNVALVPTTWGPNEIILDIPAMPPNCYALRWLVDQSQGAEFFNQQSAACARFFGDRPLFSPVIPYPISNISAVGKPAITYFTADKVSPKLNAEGCTPVEIAWEVDRLVCSNSAATFAFQLTDDTGAVLSQGASIKGTISVTGREDRVYTLTANNSLQNVRMPTATATLEVERYQRLTAIRKVSPAGLVRAGSVVTIEVEISCPADDPAVVVLSSDQPNRCPGLTITVPIGQTRATGQVTTGAATGRVTLSGSVSGVSQVPVRETFVVNNPAFDALIGSALEQCDGGFVTLRVRGATSVSSVGLSGPGGFIPSSAPLQVTPSVPSDPASGTLQVTARFGALDSGTYAIQVQADGVMLAGGQVACALGNPSVNSPTATPNVVPVCTTTQVTISATSRRATELSITKEDGTVVGGPVQGTNPCGSLSVAATVQLTEKATFKAVAKRPGAPTATADVTVGETTIIPFTMARATLVNIMNQVLMTRTLPDGTTVQEAVEVTLFVYVVSVKPNGPQTTSRLGSITSPNGSISYTPEQCELFTLWALRTDDPAEMGTLNWKFGNGLFLGHPSFQALQFPIGGS